MNPILKHWIVAHANGNITQQSGAVPYWGVYTYRDITKDSGIGGNKVGVFQVRLFAIVGEPS